MNEAMAVVGGKRPYGTRGICGSNPASKRRAISSRPSGTGWDGDRVGQDVIRRMTRATGAAGSSKLPPRG
jgi:hypothetical protein